jgi:hypothetical protein
MLQSAHWKQWVFWSIKLKGGKSMTEITKTFRVYAYDELDEKVQERIINEEINYIIERVPYAEMTANARKAIDKAWTMHMSWCEAAYIWDYCKKEILELVRDYGEVFLSDGTYDPKIFD